MSSENTWRSIADAGYSAIGCIILVALNVQHPLRATLGTRKTGSLEDWILKDPACCSWLLQAPRQCVPCPSGGLVTLYFTLYEYLFNHIQNGTLYIKLSTCFTTQTLLYRCSNVPVPTMYSPNLSPNLYSLYSIPMMR